MAKDYNRRPSSRKSSSSKQLFRLIASFLFGYLTATVFDFTSLSTWVNANILAKQAKEKARPQETIRQSELPKPKFEFYTLLANDQKAIESIKKAEAKPESSKSIPAQIAHQTIKPNEPTDKKPMVPTQLNNETYFIQIAAFKTKHDAEQMKASLILKGFDVQVRSSERQGVHWFRVSLGPFNSRARAEKIQLNLATTERIKGMIRKMDA